MSIEKFFDISLVAGLALKEKQIQQNYRPIIAVHKWFARRPGSLFRALVLAEFGGQPIGDTYFRSNDFPDRVVLDPFMGGGTPLIEANRVGCAVHGFDINPMSAWIVRQEIEHLDIDAYRASAASLIDALANEIAPFYRTNCPLYGDRDVPVKYFLWVKVLECCRCKQDFDLFPGYLIADDSRHTGHVLVCPSCGDLNEVSDRSCPGECASCAAVLQLAGPAKRSRCKCPHCGEANRYPDAESGPPRHRMFAIEYYNPRCKHAHSGRFFKKPDEDDLARAAAAAQLWTNTKTRFVPKDEIRAGDESSRLHRWGYERYRELFNERQLLGLERSCKLIEKVGDQRIRDALATNLSDLLRYQNLLCRYDTTALKSLDIFSVHGFPVGLVQCESNLLGITNSKGANVGSGGWTNIVEKFVKAKQYCDAPFEIQHHCGRKVQVPITGEWIGEHRDGACSRRVEIRCVSSTDVDVQARSVDAVFTDPPYFGNVQYSELMDFCYVWLKSLVGPKVDGFSQDSTRSVQELTGNDTESRDLAHFTAGLSKVYRRMGEALTDTGPLAFTFHHNQLSAYSSVAVAILNGGFYCSATIPCPAEMGGSIHIHGTGSSIVDTVFVCRKSKPVIEGQLPQLPALIERLQHELRLLSEAGLRPSHGDVRCIVFGNLARLAVNALHQSWDADQDVSEQLAVVAETIAGYGAPDQIIETLMLTADRLCKRGQKALPLFPQDDLDAVSL